MDAKDWDARYAASELVWSQGPNEHVERALGDLAPGTALDLAAGEGRNALWLARRGWRVTAVDFSHVGLTKGRRLAGDLPVTWVCADATTWSGPAVDLVVVAYLQLPAEPRGRAVRAAFDVLVPGGTLLVVAHDTTNLAEGTGGPQDPTVLYTAEDVLADLGDRAVEVRHAGRVARTVPAADGHGPAGTAWDAVLHVRRASVTTA